MDPVAYSADDSPVGNFVPLCQQLFFIPEGGTKMHQRTLGLRNLHAKPGSRSGPEGRVCALVHQILMPVLQVDHGSANTLDHWALFFAWPMYSAK